MTETATNEPSIRVSVRDESDVGVARRRVRELGARVGLSEASVEELATAVTEIARNIVVHAGTGELLFGATDNGGRRGVVVLARDHGPGIADVFEAMRDGYSSGSGLGLGLPSARRLVDEFELASSLDSGTTIMMRKWTPVERQR
ncbi:MAG TPA: anti-sigma regulatory factor [Polyangiaceae bacterium]|jgi:serine/threonine-protein kinase RsbT|nr:anti-sigma regulatory factor [Polyangiaceae bacterium]